MTDKEIEVIVKPIFTKMFNANFSACEYGIECYKKGMEYQGIKELAIENDNLIKRVADLEKENAELKRDKEDLIFIRNQNAKCMCEDKEKLTKAKHYIKELVRAVEHSYSVLSWQRPPIKAEAEQFLSEE